MTVEQFEKAKEIMQIVNDSESNAHGFKTIIVNNISDKGVMPKRNFKLDELQEKLLKVIDQHFSLIKSDALIKLRKI